MAHSTRTTITVDADLLNEVKRQSLQNHMTVSEFIQDSVRERLAKMRQRSAPFTVRAVRTGGYQPGVDITDSAALHDLMERE